MHGKQIRTISKLALRQNIFKTEDGKKIKPARSLLFRIKDKKPYHSRDIVPYKTLNMMKNMLYHNSVIL